MSTVLLTGASGEIGRPLIERLAGDGHDLRIISRRAHEAGAEPGRWLRADLLDRASLERACRCEPVVVIHMAAVTHSADPAAYEAVNVDGTRNLIAALAAAPPRRFIHLSTRAIGRDGGGYAASKERGEAVVRASSLAWTVLRPAEVYGSGGKDPILSLAHDLRRRSFVPILGDGSYRLAPVYAGDVVDVIHRAMTGAEGAAVGETYVLAGPESLTYLELVAKLELLQGLPRRRRVRIPLVLARALIGASARIGLGAYVPDQVPRLLLPKSDDNRAARRDLGFEPRSLEAVLPALLGPETTG